MTRVLRPREEFPTPAFRGFLAVLALVGPALALRLLL